MRATISDISDHDHDQLSAWLGVCCECGLDIEGFVVAAVIELICGASVIKHCCRVRPWDGCDQSEQHAWQHTWQPDVCGVIKSRFHYDGVSDSDSLAVADWEPGTDVPISKLHCHGKCISGVELDWPDGVCASGAAF